MINVVISLIYTAIAILQSEVEARLKAASDATGLQKSLFILQAVVAFLRDGDAAGLAGAVNALNRSVDATPQTEVMVIKPDETLTPEKLSKLKSLVEKNTPKPIK
jgi:predicted DNA-binding protein